LYDVIIVGAGPGGSFTAKLLAEAGYDIVLIEKDTLPRDKPCGGWITPQVLDLVKLTPSQLKCCQPIYGAVLWEPKKDQLFPYVVKYNKPVSYGIRRMEFDSILTNQAKDAGAEVLNQTTITNVYRQKKIVFVQAGPNQELKGKFVVGADGTHSVVAKDLWIRRKWNPSELIQCIVCETEVGENIQKLTDYYGFPELFLDVESNGFSWYFTKGSYLNIGLGIQMSRITPNRTAQTIYTALLQKLQQINHLNGVNLAPIKSHLYPVYNGPFNYPTYEDRVILIGDAGGFPINCSGEGIRPALLTGKFAAETLIKALERDDTNLNSYHLKWYDALRNEYIIGDLLQLIYSPSNHQLYKSLFLEDRRFRRLFFDIFFKRKTPRELLRDFLFYSPFLSVGFFRYGLNRLQNYR
jgi:geranylgeranyl reductase family protein